MDTPGGSYTPPSTPSTGGTKPEELVRPTQPPKDPIMVLILNLLAFGGVGYIIMGQKMKGYVAIVVFPTAAETGTLGELLDLEAWHHTRCGMTEDHREAARAFVEKREPVFRGR